MNDRLARRLELSDRAKYHGACGPFIHMHLLPGVTSGATSDASSKQLFDNEPAVNMTSRTCASLADLIRVPLCMVDMATSAAWRDWYAPRAMMAARRGDSSGPVVDQSVMPAMTASLHG